MFSTRVSAVVTLSLITGLVLAIARNRELKESRSQLAMANDQLRATLENLQTELLDRALGDALAGDTVACEYSLARAAQADASKEMALVFRGLMWLYAGRLDEAMKLLEQARQEAPDDLSVLAVLLAAYFQSGDIQKGTEVSDRIAYVESTDHRPKGDYERLLVANTKVFSTYDPKPLVDELADVISRHPRWGIAYAIRADAKAQLAKATRQMTDLKSAREDAERAAEYQPDNAFVLASGMHTYIASIELARHQRLLSEKEQKELERKAEEIAARLGTKSEYYDAMTWRATFFRLMNREQDLQDEYRKIQALGYGGDQSNVARMLVAANPRTEVQEYLRRNPDSFAARTATALLDVLKGTGCSAENSLALLREKFTNLNQRWLMVDIALAAQDQALARRLANEFYQQAVGKKVAIISREDLIMTEFYAGLIDENALLEKCGPFMIESSVGHYAIGMWKLSSAKSSADLNEVKEHLTIAANCPVPGWWHVEFAKAYLQLIQQGCMPRQ